MNEWYLLRTKTGEERKAEALLGSVVDRTLLPLGKTKLRLYGRVAERLSPLFPCYLFAFFSLAHTAREIRYTPGVRGIVRFGEQAAVVPRWVIDELTLRYANGPIEFEKARLSPGDPVRVLDGPFRQIEAIFDGYLSGTERVAVLMSIMNAERRVVMPARNVLAVN